MQPYLISTSRHLCSARAGLGRSSQPNRGRRGSACTPSAAGWRPKLIVTDVDGTLVNSEQQLTDIVSRAVTAAAEAGIPLAIATGKARGPWYHKISPRLGPASPGVFIQGCLLYQADGTLIESEDLPEDVCMEAIRFAREQNVTLAAFCCDRILAEETDDQTDRLLFYNDPIPEAIGPLEGIVGRIPVQKMIFMVESDRMDSLRPLAMERFQDAASLTIAIPGMLEVLPLGVSKGSGVRKLLDTMRVNPEDVMAIGDGENDIEMLEMVGLGVAMGNAVPEARAVAAETVPSNNEDGVAEAIFRFALPQHRTS
mmetsp:Transcript_2933/g.8270  ORF Transcript_2933/g.8270 Transcript_2933/m.8270 type:complete len:312 (+) Transcript_2933:136-1071(+)